MKTNRELAARLDNVTNLIYSIRGNQVMVDRDLAEMYQVETKVLNQAVKRNIVRFPDSFRFQLTESEVKELVAKSDQYGHLGSKNTMPNSRSQNVTLKTKHGQNIKYLPYAFTEQGVAMLSAVLRSETAVKVSIQIINAFVEMRKLIAGHSGLIQRMEGIEKKQIQTDQKFEQIFEALERKDVIPHQGVFFDGQVFDAYELASKIIRSAKQNILLIDNFINENTLTHLSKKGKGVRVLLLTKTISKQMSLDVQKANEQYGQFELKLFTQSHDRFLIIDGVEIYHLGASLKDLGRKWFAFSKMEKESVSSIMNEITEML